MINNIFLFIYHWLPGRYTYWIQRGSWGSWLIPIILNAECRDSDASERIQQAEDPAGIGLGWLSEHQACDKGREWSRLGGDCYAFWNCVSTIQKSRTGAGFLAQQLRALATVTEDLGSGPRTYVVTLNHSELQFQGIQPPFMTLEDFRHTWGAYTDMQAKHSYT